MTDYTSESIRVLDGLDPVKKRPGMYTDTVNPNHLAAEVIDNSIDEALAGHASVVDITIHKDGSMTVADDGRGMPIDMMEEQGMPGVEVLMTKLHAGGKFDGKNYKHSGGLHGVGISVVNALSQTVIVHVKREGFIHKIQFEDGHTSSPLEALKKCPKKETGTSVTFKPDAQYFDTATFNVKHLCKNLKAKAILCPQVTIRFTDENTNQTDEYHYEDGLNQYLVEETKGYDSLPSDLFSGCIDNGDDIVEWALNWTPEIPSTINDSYVNLIPTAQGGTHVNGLKTGLVNSAREFCDYQNLLPKNVKLSPDDVFSNINFVLSIKMTDPQFAGQTKERLSSRESAGVVGSVIKDAFSLWLNENIEEAKLLAEHFIASANKRLKQAKKVTRKRVTQGPALPGKLTDCASQDLSVSELFLVEGDSAGGSAKQARDREFQAIMPLRGKILNSWEVPSDQVLGSAEIHDISVAIGVDPQSDDFSSLRYGKICILADADSDGLHIATLLCGLFYKHYRPLIEAGHIYVAMPPLYRIDYGKEVYYALDEQEKDQHVAGILKRKSNANYNVQRFKGLGEMNPLQLQETTMQPETRRLIQLNISDIEKADELMDLLLGKKRAGDRKKWLEEKGDQVELV